MPEISLIPPQQKERALPRFATFQGPKLALSPATKVILSLLAVLVLATAVLYGWSLSLKASNTRLNEELAAAAKERDAALERRLKEVGELIASFEGLKKEHRTWSRLFGVLESKAVAGLTFTAFEGSEDTGLALLRGLAANYKTIANQVKSLETEEKIERVELTTLNLNTEGEVEFQMNFYFDKTLIKSSE